MNLNYSLKKSSKSVHEALMADTSVQCRTERAVGLIFKKRGMPNNRYSVNKFHDRLCDRWGVSKVPCQLSVKTAMKTILFSLWSAISN